MGDARVVHTHPEWFAEPNHGFAWIRMIGALAVVYGHSSPLAGTGDLFPSDWPVQPDEGVLMGFFAMSGFQITESWIRDPHPGRFAAKRILRLWPPMLTVSLIMSLIIGPMITSMSASDYFAANGTWGYVVNNAGLLTLKHELPGVFVDNPWPNAVNGSLWTLPMELLAYAALYALLLLGAGKHKYRWLAVVALIGIITWDRYLEELPGSESAGSFLSVPVESLVAFLVAFAFGVVLNLYRIPLSPLAASGGLVLLVLMPNSTTGSFWMAFAVSYAVVVTGHFWPSRLTVPGVWVNGSYGVYVWGFPIQQLLAMAGIRNQWLMLICAAPLTYCVGTLSWKFIEEPTMKLRHYLTPAPKKKEPERAEDDLDELEDLYDSGDPDDFDDLEPDDPDERDDDRAARFDDPDEPRAAREATTMRRPPPRPPAPNRDGAAQELPTKLTPARPGADQARPARPLRRPTAAPTGTQRPTAAPSGAPRNGAPPNDIPRNGVSPNGTPVNHNRVNGAPRHGSADGPNAARLNGLPMNGTEPPHGRPSAHPSRLAEQRPVGPPAVPSEDSVLAKRLSGDLDLDLDQTSVDRPAVRRTGGRHARPEPPPTPEEETRPVRPKRQDCP
ncbi:acyltransferase family protein [Saccharopolyspora spinosa]|uniref:acyltransferase family protein n=1 Tax=Saccharopolyspora spinosa TaxID=60894 RepID=UPI0002EBF29B|nr:acyltransferase [Saccharopolyspora spinosa]